MNLQMLLPIVSKAIGRDISGEVNLFYRARAAVGAALNSTGQEFFMKNWHSIPSFMETAAGRKATADFMNAWAASLFPKNLQAEPIPDPAPLPALQQAAAAPAPTPQPAVPTPAPTFSPIPSADHATGGHDNAFL